MPQLFHRSSNALARITIYGFVFIIAALAWACLELQHSPWVTRQAEAREQWPPFSHQHHVGGLGIDCRYCHTSVETSSFAGIPPTKTCMNCHSQMWTGSDMLQPVRMSFTTGQSLQWIRVNDLPDFVFFQHDIHINKGIGCNVCHGRVSRMPLMMAAQTLQMQWCLDCHRAPEKYIRPRDQVFNVDYVEPRNQLELGRRLVKEYHVRSARDITSCSTCHR